MEWIGDRWLDRRRARFMDSFNNHLLRTFFMLKTILGTVSKAVGLTHQVSALREFILVAEDRQQTRVIHVVTRLKGRGL